LRIGARSRNGAHICQQLDPVLPEQFAELLNRTRRMADRLKRRRLSPLYGINGAARATRSARNAFLIGPPAASAYKAILVYANVSAL
jgi:hypothetical protein